MLRETVPSNEHAKSGLRRRMPRPETTILIAAFVLTVGAKLLHVLSQPRNGLLVTWAKVSLPDAVFFSATALLIALVYLYRPRPLAIRCVLLASGFLLAWSVVNGAWLVVTGIQLQPTLLSALIENLFEFWPAVWSQLCDQPAVSVPMAVVVLGTLAWVLWRVVKPVRVVATRTHRGQRAVRLAIVLAIALTGQATLLAAPGFDFARETLAFSSHWSGFVTATRNACAIENHKQIRTLAHSGDRKVGLPSRPDELPNVVLLMLESVPHRVTSLHDAESGLTPNLLQLAREGVELGPTRVPLPQTGKAYWAALTGTTPDIQPDYVEAVLVDRPYEGLPTILGRSGYRTAFFAGTKGTFECAPGTMANMGFDHAWFRESLEDPAAYIGYLGADDFRVLDPAFEWVDADKTPFLLTLITTIAHDPFIVPSWFASPAEDRYERYLQTVRYTDAFIGEVRERLARRGLGEDTILCVIGDHGQSFRNNDVFGRWIPFEDLIRIPWVLHWPGHVGPAQRADWPCSQIDVTPTILALIGFDIAEAGFEGRNALEPADPSRRCYFSSWYLDSPLGYTEGTRKWFYWPYIDKVFMFDLVLDPGEENPQPVNGAQREQVVADLIRWTAESRVEFSPQRYRERVLFDHWRAVSSGRSAWARYEP